MNYIANDIAARCDHETYVWTAQNCPSRIELNHTSLIAGIDAWTEILWATWSEHLVEVQESDI